MQSTSEQGASDDRSKMWRSVGFLLVCLLGTSLSDTTEYGPPTCECVNEDDCIQAVQVCIASDDQECNVTGAFRCESCEDNSCLCLYHQDTQEVYEICQDDATEPIEGDNFENPSGSLHGVEKRTFGRLFQNHRYQKKYPPQKSHYPNKYPPQRHRPKPIFPKLTFPKLKFPKLNIPKLRLPKINLPKIKLPKIKLPKLKIPKIKFPKIKIPKINFPKFPNIPKKPYYPKPNDPYPKDPYSKYPYQKDPYNKNPYPKIPYPKKPYPKDPYPKKPYPYPPYPDYDDEYCEYDLYDDEPPKPYHAGIKQNINIEQIDDE